VEVPWNLRVAEHAIIGDHVILYCLGPVSIGARTTISQYSHLCAGTHDHTKRSFPLLRQPITIGDDVWLAADVFVGPNVNVGNGVVVGARSTVVTDLPEWKICVGQPARPVRDRILVDGE
jgi:putative colanic acid biosynthesis acetyltransferase WcaF